MDILFKVEEQREYVTCYAGTVEGVPVGHALLFQRSEHVGQLFEISIVDKDGGKLSLQEFAEVFFRYLKTQGYTELWMDSGDMDSENSLGFQLEDWDNSGWYPKYYFCRRL